ncbi:PREDICTED: oxygen-regulated protein 1, partial [Phaethon lepturus]|uniref:oxygen-regulated protein 1 n=1 Tax=Phaethon lepturus TaxID=97097 RepID=UPI00053048B2
MSETPSTSYSVNQPNSSESEQSLSTRHFNVTEPVVAKRICFYKSGDPQFNGIKMVINNRSYKTFDALLDSLSKRVPLPFGVRNISTPKGRHSITNLEDLEDGKSYICSHQRKMKPINLEQASKKPLPWLISRPVSAHGFGHRENKITTPKNMLVFKNGDVRLRRTVVLGKKNTQTFGAFLDYMSELMQYPVVKLYTTDGRKVPNLQALILCSGALVAAGREPFKPSNYDSLGYSRPAKLLGIANRVYPKANAKSESENTRAEMSSSSRSQIFSVSSDKGSSNDNSNDNNSDSSYVPDSHNSIGGSQSVTGEDLSVAQYEDDIEKSVHVNQDGSITVEMKVRFKIKEEETIKWTTTVSRAGLSDDKNTTICNSAMRAEDCLSNVKVSEHIKPKDALFLKSHSKEEGDLLQQFNAEVSDKESESDLKIAGCSIYKRNNFADLDVNNAPEDNIRPRFYRPPTPGPRRVRQKKAVVESVTLVSEKEVQEKTIGQFSYSEEIQNKSNKSEYCIVAHSGRKKSSVSNPKFSKSVCPEDEFYHQDSVEQNGLSSNKKPRSNNNKLAKVKMKSDKLNKSERAITLEALTQEDFQEEVVEHSVENYVQTWLKNLSPNSVLPPINKKGNVENSNVCHFPKENTDASIDKEARFITNKVHVTEKKHLLEHNLTKKALKPICESGTLEESAKDSGEKQTDSLIHANTTIVEEAKYSLKSEFHHGGKLHLFHETHDNVSEVDIQDTNLCQRKKSEVAVQVDCAIANEKMGIDVQSNCMSSMLLHELQSALLGLQKEHSGCIGKACSLSDLSPSSFGSSSNVLLAWLLVLNLRDGSTGTIKDDMQKATCSCSEILTQLQFLKQTTVIEKVDELKAAFSHFQQSTENNLLQFGRELKKQDSTHCHENIPISEIHNGTHLHENEISVERSAPKDSVNSEEALKLTDELESCFDIQKDLYQDTSELEGARDIHIVSDKSEDEKADPKSAGNDKKTNYQLKLAAETSVDCNNEDYSVQEDKEETETGEETSERLSTVSPLSFCYESKQITEYDMSEGEQKLQGEELENKMCLDTSQLKKCLKSPATSDWSDYRPDTEESDCSFRASSDLTNESGEEAVLEKHYNTGYVKRTIERLYGKTEASFKPDFHKGFPYMSKVFQKDAEEFHSAVVEKNIFFSQGPGSCSAEKLSHSSLPSQEFPININKDNTISRREDTSLPTPQLTLNREETSYTNDFSGESPTQHCQASIGTNEDEGILIEKGKWLLKENHLIRRSPPEQIGMYGNLDTTSTDTVLDTNSDDVPYSHFGNLNQYPVLNEISSSELEDMAKPSENFCNYFNIPHNSDSDPFQDDIGAKSKRSRNGKINSLPAANKEKIKPSVMEGSTSTHLSTQADTNFSAFTSVEFRLPDNKVHPLEQPLNDEPIQSQPTDVSNANRSALQEEDSLDKLHAICGQHCPILMVTVTPLNEEQRGYAYRKASDIENQLGLCLLAKKSEHMQWSCEDLITDENSHVTLKNNCINKIANNIFNKFYANNTLDFISSFGILATSTLKGTSSLGKLHGIEDTNVKPMEVSNCQNNVSKHIPSDFVIGTNSDLPDRKPKICQTLRISLIHIIGEKFSPMLADPAKTCHSETFL